MAISTSVGIFVGEPQMDIFGMFNIPLYDSERHMLASKSERLEFASAEGGAEELYVDGASVIAEPVAIPQIPDIILNESQTSLF